MVEVIGGLWLLLGTLSEWLNLGLPINSADGALILLILTFLVTPANIYMYTHGARMPLTGPEIPVVGHYIRLFLQVS